jgi:hypothetical protein
MSWLSKLFSNGDQEKIARYEELLSQTSDDDAEYTPEIEALDDERIELFYQLPSTYCVECHGICAGGH